MMRSSFHTGWKSLLIAIACVAGGCGQQPPNVQKSVTKPSQHPHTKAMLKMVHAMERAGYRPSLAEHRNKSFAEDPIVWLGPWHIDVPNDDPFQVEWRLTIYRRGLTEQYHSFVSAEYEGRFNEQLVAVLVNEWERMAAVGLPQAVVDRGRLLIEQAEEEYARQREEQYARQRAELPPNWPNSSQYKLNAEGRQGEQYALRVEFYDTEGFSDAEGVVLPFARAILFFTLVEPEQG
jgi:hypothetical protein